MSASADASDLQKIYRGRFHRTQAYRSQVWSILISDFFFRWIRPTDAVLDLGCGYGEFINQIRCREKFGIDLNPDTRSALGPDVTFFDQDCSENWPLPDESLDLVFTSNFFEHLPDKPALGRTLAQAWRCLKPSGYLIAVGPNIRRVQGAYWDFWDHHIPLSHLSLAEGMRLRNFEVETAIESFLPYTLVDAPRFPLFLIRLYLRLPAAWRIFGRQFLIVARKRGTVNGKDSLV